MDKSELLEEKTIRLNKVEFLAYKYWWVVLLFALLMPMGIYSSIQVLNLERTLDEKIPGTGLQLQFLLLFVMGLLPVLLLSLLHKTIFRSKFLNTVIATTILSVVWSAILSAIVNGNIRIESCLIFGIIGFIYSFLIGWYRTSHNSFWPLSILLLLTYFVFYLLQGV